MKSFEYTIKDELGIHARPAGMLVKEAKNFASEFTITKDGKTKKLTQLMMLMSLGVKQGVLAVDNHAAFDPLPPLSDCRNGQNTYISLADRMVSVSS